MDVIVRRLREEDIANGFLESLESLFPVALAHEEAREIFHRVDTNPSYRIFIAEYEGKVVGASTLLVEQKFILKGAKFGYLEDMSVHPQFQHKGIGTKLIGAAIEEAKKEGCINIRLDCNDTTKAFYEKSGFAKKSQVNRMQINLRRVEI